MGYYPGLNKLRDVLADFYPTKNQAQMIIAQAGISEQLINFDGSALEFWKSILAKAHNNRQVQNLIDEVRKTFANNELLLDAEKEFYETPVPPLPTLEDKPDTGGNGSNGGSGSGNVSISVGGNNEGFIAGGSIKDANLVKTGDVTGDGNVIGVDNQATNTINKAAKPEASSLEDFQQLLEELKTALESVAAQTDLLKQIDPAAPFTAPGAAEHVASVAADLKNGNPKDPTSIGSRLNDASELVEGILDKAKGLTDKAGDVGHAATRVAELFGPISQKLRSAVEWVVQLWPQG